jgi:hypothetical protein
MSDGHTEIQDLDKMCRKTSSSLFRALSKTFLETARPTTSSNTSLQKPTSTTIRTLETACQGYISLGSKVKQGITMKYDKIHRVIGHESSITFCNPCTLTIICSTCEMQSLSRSNVQEN